jgi:hypothetical protein
VHLPGGIDEGLGEHRETRRRADDGDRGHACILQTYDRMARAYNSLMGELEVTICDLKLVRSGKATRVRRLPPRHAFSIAGARAGA